VRSVVADRPDLFVRYRSGLNALVAATAHRSWRPVNIYTIIGGTGIGKSFAVHDL